jgi:hypothetical protein
VLCNPALATEPESRPFSVTIATIPSTSTVTAPTLMPMIAPADRCRGGGEK